MKIFYVNRRAAGTGSVRYAMATSNADYNGHNLSVSFKEHAVSGPTWNCEYYWGERVVLARGSQERCIQAALQYMARGHRGSNVITTTNSKAPESLEQQEALLHSHGFIEGKEELSWWTGAHSAVCDAISWERNFPGILQVAIAFPGSPDEWPAARSTWLQRKNKTGGTQ